MTLDDLIKLAQNRLASLERMREACWASGDAAGVAQADAQIAQTQFTLQRLHTLE